MAIIKFPPGDSAADAVYRRLNPTVYTPPPSPPAKKSKKQQAKSPARQHVTLEQQVKQNNRRVRSDYGLKESITVDEWEALLKRCGYACVRCGVASRALTIDHIMPLIRGGTNRISNIQPLCRRCNGKKGAW